MLTDDQGPWALGHRNPDLHTPAVDGLVVTGTELDRFFCASPVCSPARASLLTGRMPSAHGVHDWVRGEAYGVPDDDPHERVNRAADPACAAVRDELAGVLHVWFARHNAAERDAFARPVSGRGQTSPLWRGRSDAGTYATAGSERRKHHMS